MMKKRKKIATWRKTLVKSNKKAIKRPSKSLYKKAYAECEIAWKAAARRRDGSCRIPGCGATEALQIDHCFSRTIKQLFFDIQNATTLCSGCHLKKTLNQNGYEKMVDKIVRDREGEQWWMWASIIAHNHKGYKHTLEELETIKKELNGLFLEEKD